MKILASDVRPGHLIEVTETMDDPPVRMYVLDTVRIGGVVHVDAHVRFDGGDPSPWGDDFAECITAKFDDIETVYLRG